MTDQTSPVEAPSNKELNFRALEQKYAQREGELRQEVAKERAAREELQRKVAEREETPYTEPYIDERQLHKTLNKFGQDNLSKAEGIVEKKVREALESERNSNWLEQNPDFQDILNNHAKKLIEVAPGLAKSILEMPDNFERQKLVYNNIKALRLHEAAQKQPSIQEKIDANRRSPYYQPSGVGASPYASNSDFSPSGQKNAYDKMKDLQKRMRLG